MNHLEPSKEIGISIGKTDEEGESYLEECEEGKLYRIFTK